MTTRMTLAAQALDLKLAKEMTEKFTERKVAIHRISRESSRDGQLPFKGQLQTPDTSNGKYEDRKIRKKIDDSSDEEKSLLVDAFPRYPTLPDFVPRDASSDRDDQN